MDKKIDNAMDTIQQELKWANHYREGFTRQEIEIDLLEDEIVILKDRIEELENKYEREGYDDTRY
jgi:polyhydroxyalkanoate synthesis regulator phasin